MGTMRARSLEELMFVDVVRHYLETIAGRPDGLAGGSLRAPFVGRALTALHRKPPNPWTIESLARNVGLSRSALRSVLPVRGSASDALPDELADATRREPIRSGVESVSAVANLVGYESEAAFSRAFKKWWARRRANGVITGADGSPQN